MYVEDNVLNEDKMTGEFAQEAEICGVDEETKNFGREKEFFWSAF